MGLEAGLAASRWLHYVAVTGLFGLGLFRLYAPRAALRAAPALARLAVLFLVFAVVSALAWFAFVVINMAGGLADALATAPTVIIDTDFGPLWGARLGLALVLIFPAARKNRWVFATLTAALLASLALTGHARIHEGAAGGLHMASDAIHLLAAGAWLGALSAFVVLLRVAPREPETARALADFSAVGMLAVAALVATGLTNAWMVLGGVEPLFSTTYGRLLILKVALFALMLGLAALNRFRLVPALGTEADTTALGRLRQHVAAEQGLGLAVLLVVGLLGTLDPTA
jgi:putative copper resistance protein D